MQNENQTESKRERIEELLQEGKTPEEIAEIVDCTSRYVYHIKAQVVGVKERAPSTKDNITDIKERIEAMGDDLHKLALQDDVYFRVCPACKDLFDTGAGDVCPECNVLFCSPECVKEHGKKGFFDDKSKCEEYKQKVSELIGDDEPAPEEPTGNKEPKKDDWL